MNKNIKIRFLYYIFFYELITFLNCLSFIGLNLICKQLFLLN